MKKSINQQVATYVQNFQNSELRLFFPNENVQSKEGLLPLLIFPETILSTKEIFNKINLGRMEDNTWFLDPIHMYNIVKDIPTAPYVLPNINIGSATLVPSNYTHYDFNGPRPLTFHEVVTLAFQYPLLFSEKISGMQAYGSRFANSKSDVRNADTDDTLEIYRKGNPGNGLLKLAREHHRYWENTKIIPFTED